MAAAQRKQVIEVGKTYLDPQMSNVERFQRIEVLEYDGVSSRVKARLCEIGTVYFALVEYLVPCAA